MALMGLHQFAKLAEPAAGPSRLCLLVKHSVPALLDGQEPLEMVQSQGGFWEGEGDLG